MFPSIFGALASGASSLLGGFLSQGVSNTAAGAARRAASVGEQAAQNAANAQVTGYKNAICLQQPIMQQGLAANTLYGNAVGANCQQAQQTYYNNFQNDPGYLATLNQGIRAVQQGGLGIGGASGGAGTGQYNSGGTLKALMGWGQQQQEGQYLNRLNQLNTLGQQGISATNNIGNYDVGQGGARAQGILGVANARIGGIQGVAQANEYGQNAMNQGITGAIGSFLGAAPAAYNAYASNNLSSIFQPNSALSRPQQPQLSGFLPQSTYGLGGFA